MGLFSDRQHARARFYDSLATALDAGLTTEHGLATLAKSGEGLSAELLPGVRLGQPLSTAMTAATTGSQDATFGRFEVLAAQAGEASGRLPEVLQRLARSFALRGKTRDRVAYSLVYPILVLHLVVLLPPAYLLVRDGLDRYLGAVVPIFVAAYLVLGVGWWLLRGLTAGESGRLKRDRLLLRLPGVSKAFRSLALAEYAHAFAILFSAGVPMPETLARAAEATRNRVFRGAGHRVCERVRSGGTVQEGLASELGVFPQTFVQAVAVGERAGKLEEALDQAAERARDDAERTTLALAVSTGVVAYGIAVLAVVWVVIGFFTGLAKLPPGI